MVEREREPKEEKQAPCARESISTSGRVDQVRGTEVRWAPTRHGATVARGKIPAPQPSYPRGDLI